MTDTARWPHVAALLEWGIARQPAKPFLTYYDDTTGERVELSYATFGNWVAKTGNLLRSLDVTPGSRVAVLLPSHWQTVVAYFAGWAIGAVTVVIEHPDELAGADAEVLIVGEQSLADVAARRGELGPVREVLGLSLRPMNAGLTAARPGVTDYADEVLAHGDDLVSEAVDLELQACDVDGRVLSAGELVQLALDLAVAQELGPHDRCLVLIGGGPLDDGLIAGSLACFVAGAGLALVLGLRPADLPARCAHEKITLLAAPAEWLLRAAQEEGGRHESRLRTVVARGDGDAPDVLLGAPVIRL